MGRRRQDRSESPELFIPPSVAAELGSDAHLLLEALAGPSPVSIRYNTLKTVPREGEPIPWCTTGSYLRQRPVFTLDPAFHAGAYYVQEASSMLVEQAFRATGLAGEDILAIDLCAAPGGKSTHLAALMSTGSLLIANESAKARQAPLVENLRKQGCPNVVVMGDMPGNFRPVLGGRCDLVVVDAPCSGEGMFRKEPHARRQWSERLVASCARTQAGIVDDGWELLSPGGYLLYSTCTWERSENEEQVRRLLDRGAEHIPLPLDPAWGIVAGDTGYRCYPHRLQGEGFFIALVRKPGSRVRSGPGDGPGPVPPFAAPWIDARFPVRTLGTGDELFAVPAAWSTLVQRLAATVHTVSPGVAIAERRGDRWRPHAALALNKLCRQDAFRTVDLDLNGALAYLRGETAVLQATPVTGPEDALLVRYQGLALGWAFAAGARWNNGWPASWRIRMR